MLNLASYNGDKPRKKTACLSISQHFSTTRSQDRFSYQLQWRESFLASEEFNFPLSCCAEELTSSYKEQQRPAAKQITARTLTMKT